MPPASVSSQYTRTGHWNVAPTLFATRNTLPPEGANFPRGGPSENCAVFSAAPCGVNPVDSGLATEHRLQPRDGFFQFGHGTGGRKTDVALGRVGAEIAPRRHRQVGALHQ